MRKFDAPDFLIGTTVKSFYAARWTGVICEKVACYDDNQTKKWYVGGKNHIVRCTVTHDRNGRPVRKPFKSITLSTSYLKEV